MLREVRACRQIEGEPFRRWFTSRRVDLFLWYEGDALGGFQLCVRRWGEEVALTWRAATGWRRQEVADEGGPYAGKRTQVLGATADGTASWVLRTAIGEAGSTPRQELSFVLDKLAAQVAVHARQGRPR